MQRRRSASKIFRRTISGTLEVINDLLGWSRVISNAVYTNQRTRKKRLNSPRSSQDGSPVRSDI